MFLYQFSVEWIAQRHELPRAAEFFNFSWPFYRLARIHANHFKEAKMRATLLLRQIKRHHH